VGAPVPFILPYPSVMFDKLDEFLLELEEHDQEVSAGVASIGPAAAYALVWEWGNARQTKLGPKTTVGTNPDGRKVYLSLQAPHGWIRVNTPAYWQAFNEELNEIKFLGIKTGQVTDALEKVAMKTAKRIMAIMKETVPVDSGDLMDSLQVIGRQDPLLDDDTRALQLIGGESESGMSWKIQK
jgi:hypothetical protein